MQVNLNADRTWTVGLEGQRRVSPREMRSQQNYKHDCHNCVLSIKTVEQISLLNSYRSLSFLLCFEGRLSQLWDTSYAAKRSKG
jgi:hypothetical protein